MKTAGHPRAHAVCASTPTMHKAPGHLHRHTWQQQVSCSGTSTSTSSSVGRRSLAHQHLATAAAAVAATLLSLSTSAACEAMPQASHQVYEQSRASNPLAQLAEGGFMGFGGTADGSNPFTLYGAAAKKYVIEVLDGEKILSRKRGFTVNSCATVLSVAEEDAEGPRFQGLPVGEKVRISDATLCSKAEGSDLRPACATSCETTCRGAMGAYTDLNGRTTGIEIEEKDVQRVVKSCIRDCRSECVKPGKVFDFVVPSRR